jgi:hypothetical protein
MWNWLVRACACVPYISYYVAVLIIIYPFLCSQYIVSCSMVDIMLFHLWMKSIVGMNVVHSPYHKPAPKYRPNVSSNTVSYEMSSMSHVIQNAQISA